MSLHLIRATTLKRLLGGPPRGGVGVMSPTVTARLRVCYANRWGVIHAPAPSRLVSPDPNANPIPLILTPNCNLDPNPDPDPHPEPNPEPNSNPNLNANLDPDPDPNHAVSSVSGADTCAAETLSTLRFAQRLKSVKNRFACSPTHLVAVWPTTRTVYICVCMYVCVCVCMCVCSAVLNQNCTANVPRLQQEIERLRQLLACQVR